MNILIHQNKKLNEGYKVINFGSFYRDFVYKTMYSGCSSYRITLSVRVRCSLIEWRKVKQHVSYKSGAAATQNSGEGIVVEKMMDILFV